MRAWRVYGPGDIRFDEIEPPQPGPGEALLQVLTLQPSVTEVLGLAGTGLGAAQISEAFTKGVPAQLFGHEFAGRVLMVRKPGRGLRAGDRVSSLGRIPCGICPECRRHLPHYCSSGEMLGVTRPGCLAELVAVPTKVLARLPTGVDDGEAASLQPLASMLASLKPLARAVRGADVAVLGLGLMGLFAVQLLSSFGAESVVGISPRRHAVEACRELGITAFHLPSDLGAVRARNARCQVVVDCSGRRQLPGCELGTVGLAAQLCRAGGTILQVALYQDPLHLDTAVPKRKALRYVWPQFSTCADLSRAAALVASGTVRVRPLLTRTVEGLAQLPLAFRWTLTKSSENVAGPVQVVVSR